jgi:hypothetical protein
MGVRVLRAQSTDRINLDDVHVYIQAALGKVKG